MEGDGDGRREIGISVRKQWDQRWWKKAPPELWLWRRKEAGVAACAKTVEKTKEGRVYDSLPAINVERREVSRDGNTRENVDTRVSSPTWIASHKVGGYGLSPTAS